MPGDTWWRSRTVGRRRRVGLRAPIAAAAAALVVGVACGGDGRALRPPSPDQTTTTVAAGQKDTAVDAGSATGEEAGTSAAAPLQLTSTAIVEGGEIPADHTCRGRDVSPPLLWTGPPAGTVELAVVVRDVDAGGFVHWVVAGLAPDAGGLAEAAVPDGAAEATNDFGRPGWAGPCPPSGTHHYELRLYALAEASGVTDGQAGADASALVEGTPPLASAVLSGWAGAG